MKTILVFSVRCGCAARHSGPHNYGKATALAEGDTRCDMTLVVPLASYAANELRPWRPGREPRDRALARASAPGAVFRHVDVLIPLDPVAATRLCP